jgi:S-phase kinase-associated protein 1
MEDQTQIKEVEFTVQTGDEVEFIVPKKICMMSKTFANLIDDIGDEAMTLPAPNVDSVTFQKVIEFCTHHVNDPPAAETDPKNSDNMDPWDVQFCEIDKPILFNLILAANYLDIKLLLDATCKTVAKSLRGKTPEEIRKTYNIKNDFTPEEEAQIRKENEWCEDR